MDTAEPKTKKIKAKKIKAPKKPKIKVKRPPLKRRISFKISLIISTFLLISFTCLVTILTISIGHDSLKTYNELTSSVVARSSTALTYWLESYYKDLMAYTHSEQFLNSSIEGQRAFIEENPQMMGTDFAFVGVTGFDGIMYAENGIDADISFTENYKAIMYNGKIEYISDPSKAFFGDDWYFYASVATTNEQGNLTGLISGAIPVEIISNELERTELSKLGQVFIQDSTGTIIASPDEDMMFKNFANSSDEETGIVGYHDMIQDMLMGRTGHQYIRNKNTGENHITYYTPIYGTDWSLGLAIQDKVVLRSATINAFNIIGLTLLTGTILVIVIAIVLRKTTKPLIFVKDSIEDIASGDADLTKKLDIKIENEIGDVVNGFNQFVNKLHLIISQVKDSKNSMLDVDEKMHQSMGKTAQSIQVIIQNINNVADKITAQRSSVEETAGSVKQIAENIANLNKLIEEQSSGITVASSAIETMIENMTGISENTETMATAFVQLEQHIQNGIDKQNVVNQQIASIEEQSKMLFQANKTISKIASETNLLAMNAAIEAAHAGEAGRGFSVVADEIRKLSLSSTAQSKQIGHELQNIQESIKTVVSSSNEAQEAFTTVSANIADTDQLVKQIRSAMEQNQAGSGQITDALKMMNDSTTNVRTSSQEMSVDNRAILNQVSSLQLATNSIAESMNDMKMRAAEINENSHDLDETGNMMRKAMSDIGTQIDLFKV